MISYLGSLVQFSPTTGRAGRCRQISLCVDSTHRVPATLGLPRTGVSVLSPSTLLRLLAALYVAGPALVRFQFSGTPQKRGFGCACVLCLLRPERFRQPRGLGALSLDAVCLFPPRPPHTASGVPAACVCSQKLASSRDPPGGRCRPSSISGSL